MLLIAANLDEFPEPGIVDRTVVQHYSRCRSHRRTGAQHPLRSSIPSLRTWPTAHLFVAYSKDTRKLNDPTTVLHTNRMLLLADFGLSLCFNELREKRSKNQ